MSLDITVSFLIPINETVVTAHAHNDISCSSSKFVLVINLCGLSTSVKSIPSKDKSWVVIIVDYSRDYTVANGV